MHPDCGVSKVCVCVDANRHSFIRLLIVRPFRRGPSRHAFQPNSKYSVGAVCEVWLGLRQNRCGLSQRGHSSVPPCASVRQVLSGHCKTKVLAPCQWSWSMHGVLTRCPFIMRRAFHGEPICWCIANTLQPWQKMLGAISPAPRYDMVLALAYKC